MPPEALEIVVSPGLLRKNVHDEVPVVHQDPFRVIVALDADREASEELHPESGLVADRLDLAGVGSRADDEEIGE